MISIASGECFAWLDDDDLALPWYVDRLARALVRHETKAVVSLRCYYLEDFVWKVAAKANEVLCCREYANEVGGYPNDLDTGEDQTFVSRLKAAGATMEIFDDPCGYVYRWGQGTYHVSANDNSVAGIRYRQDAERRINEGQEPFGVVTLRPRLRHDYFAEAPSEIRRRLTHLASSI